MGRLSYTERTCPLDIDEVHIMGSCMDNGPEQHLVGNLPMEPNILVGRESPGEFRPDDPNNVTEHRQEDETSVERKDETGASGSPNRPCETVESGKPCISGLEMG